MFSMGLFSTWYYLYFGGFCFPEMKFYSGKEFCEIFYEKKEEKIAKEYLDKIHGCEYNQGTHSIAVTVNSESIPYYFSSCGEFIKVH